VWPEGIGKLGKKKKKKKKKKYSMTSSGLEPAPWRLSYYFQACDKQLILTVTSVLTVQDLEENETASRWPM
jgi:hypothetical protein